MKKGLHSKGCFLSVAETSGTYTRIPWLQSIPEMGGEPEGLDTTTLEDAVKTSIPGLKDYGSLPFTFLYDNANESSNYRVMSRLQESGKAYPFRVEYADGTNFDFTATVSNRTSAVEVDSVLQFTANLNLTSDPKLTHPSATVNEGEGI